MKRTSLLCALVAAGCAAPAPAPEELPNAASVTQYCESLGGKRIVERGPFGELGVCVFDGNRQCEEWALRLGRCPRGGIAVSAFAITSERHCAIRGGRMTIPGCALSPVGVYEAALPAAGGRGQRNVTLVLDAGRVAMLSTFFPGRPSDLAPGRWQSSGDLLTVTTQHDRLVFQQEGDRLLPREWDRSLWGAAGPGPLVRQK